MKNTTIFLLIIYILSSCSNNTANRPKGYICDFETLSKEFKQPSKEYGTAPLYVWNTKITEEVIDRTMNDLKDKGFGGVFIHPRPGLVNEYMSDDWFNMYKYTIEKAKQLDMNVWIYDENTFPSGYAGGHVNAQMPESYNQGQSLWLYRTEILPDTANKFFIVLKEKDGSFVDVTNNLEAEKGNKGKYYMYHKACEQNSTWYGGFSYVDLLYPGVTEKFLEITGGNYEKAIGSEFGKTVPGWFSDEPHIAPPGGGTRWTPDLFDVFEKKWGYDLKVNLPSIYDEVGNWKQVRHNYFQTLLEMFIERWSKPCYEYCASKNLIFTGHYWEHMWPDMIDGGDNMAMYAWHQMPGIDMLFNQFNEESTQAQFGNVRSVKELSSVANQRNLKRTLCETYGAGGWEETFNDLKRLGDWQTALGVNFMNQHLTHLSIAGDRKYDCPTSFSEHSPWWPYYKSLNMHYARLSAALSAGEQINDIIILEPNTTLWFYSVTWNNSPKLWEIGNNFQKFVTTLEKAQTEYDLGSENIIKDHGKITNKKFEVGIRSYSKVVIPPLTETLDSYTFNLLKQFVNNGGTLISFSKPNRVDGKVNDEITDFFSNNAKITFCDTLSAEVINKHFSSDHIKFDSQPGGNLFHNRRLMDDGQILFMVNSYLSKNASGKVTLKGKDAIVLNTMDGTINDYAEKVDGKNITAEFNIPPAGSLLLYVFNKKQKGYTAIPQYNFSVPVKGSEANITHEDNVLAIDFCDLKLMGKQYNDWHVFEAAQIVYKQHGFVDGNPWGVSIQYKDNIVSRDTFSTGGFIAEYHFTILDDFDMSNMKSVVEKPELYKIKVNGKEVQAEKGKWWTDRDFGVINIGKEVRKGKNTVSIEISPMSLYAEIAPVYILGNFTLKSENKGWAITKPAGLKLGSWKEQGLPFYSRSVSYTKNFEVAETGKHFQVKLNEWNGTVTEVIVNGKSAGIIAYIPHCLDVTDFIQKGNNIIEVKVVGSNKNLFGPFHNNPELGFVFPPHFRNIKSYPKGSDYQQLDYGLMDDFLLLTEN